MSKTINPSSIAELNALIPVIGISDKIKTGYVVELAERGEVVIRRYENEQEVEDEIICIGLLLYENIDEFLKNLKTYTGRKKVYLSKDYATVILAVLNGGYPEDYDE